MLLEGLRVIDAASYLAAPAAATTMADFGADVIKVEPPGGDGYRLLHGVYPIDYNWQLTSRNKRGIGLDLNKPEARRILHRLIDDADVLLLNFREDQIREFELDYDRLRATNPRLIYALLTGYGTRGPDRNKRGFDINGWWARTGIMDLMKAFGRAPVFPPGGVGDHATSMSLLAAIMMALYHRERTGEGKKVSTSLVANGCYANGMHLQGAIAGFDLSQALVERKGLRSPFASVYQTRDARYIVLVIANPGKEWPRLAAALGHTNWLSEPRFADGATAVAHRDELRDRLTDVIGSRNLADLCPALDDQDLTYEVIETISDVVRDAHLIESGVLVATGSDDPDYQWTVANPISVDQAPHRTPTPAPGIGQHNTAVLTELGLGEDEIVRLTTAGIVVSGKSEP
ncbi:MAG: CoA transferase [Proteobacteria bacterium]|nr:CoA transferase [Pseudomonadota bacterium]